MIKKQTNTCTGNIEKNGILSDNVLVHNTTAFFNVKNNLSELFMSQDETIRYADETGTFSKPHMMLVNTNRFFTIRL